MRQDAGAPARSVGHPAFAAGRVRQPVVVGERVVEVRLARREERQVAARAVEDHAIDERVRFPAESADERRARGDRAVAEPHGVKAVNRFPRAVVGEQPLGLGAARGGIGQAARFGGVEQRVVGGAAPEKKRECASRLRGRRARTCRAPARACPTSMR